MSPLVDLTSNTPSPISKIETSNVPPPKSYTATVPDFFLSKPYASAAAVGSLTILSTSSPAILPASLVACLCESLKYAGTVITALVTSWPKYFSAVSFIFCKTNAEIWEGEYFSPLLSTHASPLSAFTILNGDVCMSFCTESPSNFLPINRFAAKIVLVGFVTACLLAGVPTSCSSPNDTTDGVVLVPSAFSITLASDPSIIDTHEFVVPKSIPIILLIFSPLRLICKHVFLNYDLKVG